MVELYTEDVIIFHSISDTLEFLLSLDGDITIYYHNLKFDGNFWISFLLSDLKIPQAFNGDETDPKTGTFIKNKDMPNDTFKYSISDKGAWYTITIKENNRIIEIRDSLKLIPLGVKRIGKSFKTKHHKLDMEYEGYRYAGCEITPQEKEYIANDVLVVKEALEIMFDEGHTSLTIGACCLTEYKQMSNKYVYKERFPNLRKIKLDEEKYGSPDADAYIRKSYKGGWCYLVPNKSAKILHSGTTADVNSLYPSVMSSESGNYYPVGRPYFWTNVSHLPPKKQVDNHEVYFFIRIRTRFYLKPGKLPFIQIKGSPFYSPTKALETSDVWDKHNQRYAQYYVNKEGHVVPALVTLTLTCTDYYLLLEHYDLKDFEILDGCCFQCEKGIFDDYIEKYKRIKLTSTGGIREIAKLFLNNLYGKLATSPNSSFKKCFIKPDGAIGFYNITEDTKSVVYIPCGSAVTSYARNFTINAAQLNYHGPDKPGFIYADTDSIHCDLLPDQIQGIKVHDKDFCCWKLESCWDKAIFVRQKTYIEHVTHENLEPISEPYYNVKCAGMPDRAKDLFVDSMEGRIRADYKYTKEELEYISIKRNMEDFKIGLTVPGSLKPKRIKGGVILVDGYYQMHSMGWFL